MSDFPEYRNYIAGEFRASVDSFEVENPATGEVIATVPKASSQDVEDAVAAAVAAKKS